MLSLNVYPFTLKREKKLEKNVVSTTAAEDIGGFHGNLDIDSIIDVS